MGKKRRGARRARARADVVTVVRDPETGVMTARYLNDMGSELRAAHRGGVERVDRSVLSGGRISGRGAIAVGESFVGYLMLLGYLGSGDVLSRRSMAIQWVLDRYHRAGLGGRVSASYEGVGGRSTGGMSEKAAVALHAYGMMWARLGDRRANLLQDAIAFDLPTNDIEGLCEALDALALWRGFWDGKALDEPTRSG